MARKLEKKGKKHFAKKFGLKKKTRRAAKRPTRLGRTKRRFGRTRARPIRRRFTRRAVFRPRRNSRVRRNVKNVVKKTTVAKKGLKKLPSKKRNLTFKNFNSRRQYYLSTYYWPHWHNYYSHLNYYPYYDFYWFFYGHYHNHYPHYYSYYFHNHPSVVHYHVANTIYLAHGHRHPVLLTGVSLRSLVVNKYNVVKCQNGPKHLVDVTKGSKRYRIFMGDVNDFTNLGCLYFMDSVVSVGESAFVDRVKKLFKSKEKIVKLKGTSVTISPFKNSPFTPRNTKVKKVNKNAKVLEFTLKGKTSKAKKSLLFYHLFNKQVESGKDSKKIFKGLRKLTKKSTSNVLFIADTLEPKSILILQHLLTAYKKLSLKKIVRITYRRIRLFSGILLHHHHHYQSRAHIHY